MIFELQKSGIKLGIKDAFILENRIISKIPVSKLDRSSAGDPGGEVSWILG